MGMTILNAKQRLHEKWMELTKNGTDEETMQALSIAETVLGNYDDSLKADMMAMLTELKKEIEEQSKIPNNNASAYDWDNGVYACYKVVQQKIYALKAESEDKE